MDVAIIGCGNIGSVLATFIENHDIYQLRYLSDIDPKKTHAIIGKSGNGIVVETTIAEAVAGADLIIESACKEALDEILSLSSLDHVGKKLLVMSSCALPDNIALLNQMKYCEVLIPSGAIGGLDAIKALAGHINSLSLKTTKPVRSLIGSAYVQTHNIPLNNWKKRETLFKGNLQETTIGFPENMNVASSLYMASGFEDIEIEIIADPVAVNNTHHITCKGDFGTIELTFRNDQSSNPKTSMLAILSAKAALNSLNNKIRIPA